MCPICRLDSLAPSMHFYSVHLFNAMWMVFPVQNTVDKLIKKTNLALLVGTNSWRDQFIEAITVSAGELNALTT